MSEIDELYQELILDHNRRPRNRGPLAGANRTAQGFNPLCGDHFVISLKVDDGVVCEAKFEGTGCAISTASASLMTESIKGKTLDEAKALFRRFRQMVTGADEPTSTGESLGKLRVFSGVCRYPARVKCATLAWHAANAALEDDSGVISTE